ncbi:MAG: DUF2716 domain-containing protein [Actinomycetota bacterium]|nr:DUF2716 domain-containing protein [Actinomycetota bacterium]
MTAGTGPAREGGGRVCATDGRSPQTPWVESPYDDAWRAFAARFAFHPQYHERELPAIEEPPGCLVLDLAGVFAGGPARFAAAVASVEASAARVLLDLAGDEQVLALDWQHPAYRYSPHRLALSGLRLPVPVFPDGDYYVHTPDDLRWGTFGHPWQQTLTLWGDELVTTLGVELATWLPVRPPDGHHRVGAQS